jgi:dTMP kinase
MLIEWEIWINFTPKRMRGTFIVFEGIDHCGKSTQLRKLSKHLTTKGIPNVVVCFPERSTPIGKQIDAYLQGTKELNDQTLHRMFCQNRWEFKDEILQHIAVGKSVIIDRYAYSGVAYTSAKGLDFEWCKEGDRGLPAPDKVIFLGNFRVI